MKELSDRIAKTIFEKYNSLGRSGKPIEDAEWTLLAGFLLEKDNVLKVASLATGTKCIGVNGMCLKGLIVNDSHAEVLARRAFLRYLYSEVIKVKLHGESDIFSGISLNGNCILRVSIKFHFFTSHVPCGDASIIPMKADEIKTTLLKRNRALKRPYNQIENDNIKDEHRTGAKPVSSEKRQDPLGPAENYHIKGAVRTKPGRGDPTLSLSCSDKIARWIYVGVEGALLSQLIDGPIRLSLIVIGGGGQYNKDILEESLINRTGCTHRPVIIQSSLVFHHSQTATGVDRPSPTSIIWTNIQGEKTQISVNGQRQGCTRKSKKENICLRLCKRELFKTFLSITGKVNLNLTYREAKDRAQQYQNKFQEFKEAIGAWTGNKLITQLFKITKEELGEITVL